MQHTSATKQKHDFLSKNKLFQCTNELADCRRYKKSKPLPFGDL